MTDSDRWQDRAACVGLTWWWDVGQRAAAARTCAGCPVVVPCLVDAFAANIDAERRDREAAIADAATIAEACTPGTPACAAATQRHERAVAALDQPPTGHTRADRPALAERTLARMTDVFARVPPAAYTGGMEELTQPYWTAWFDKARKR